MEKAVRVNKEEWKVPFKKWKDAVIEETLNRMPVRVFIEVEGKKKITILSPKDGRVVRIEMFTESYEGMDDDVHVKVRGFKEMVRRGDVVDVGEGGTYWDREVRWGVVISHGEVMWLSEGVEGDVMAILTEAANIVTDSDEQNKFKEADYLQNDLVFNDLHEKVMGYKPS